MIRRPAWLPLTVTKIKASRVSSDEASAERIAFEDLTVGREFVLGPYQVSEAEILDFANRYDPQAVHTNKAYGSSSGFGGIIASGWHTGAIFMRMQCDSFLLHSTSIVSPGTDEMRWLKPVRPGDTLSGVNVITKTRRSRSKPDRGIVYCRASLSNQHSDTVMTLKTRNLFGTRDAA